MKNKWIKILGILLIVLVVGGVVAKKSGYIGKGAATKVTAEKTSTQTIIEIVSANGKIQPERELKISSDVSGEVVELFVKEGDFVQKGTLLCRINPEIYKSALERTEASVSGARSQVENSKASVLQAQAEFQKAEVAYKRNKKLHEDGVISQSDFEAIQAAYEVAKAALEASKQNVSGANYSVKSAEATLRESRQQLNKTSIYAPVDGTISKLSKEQGERVVGTNMMEGTEIMRLANLNEMEVIVDVSENDIVRVHLNDTALISVDAYNERKFKGIVTEIANSANSNEIGGSTVSTDQVINFKVKIRILRESYQDLIPANRPDQSPFRPGMSATVDIQTKRASNVLAVPVAAVTTRDTTIKTSSKTISNNSDDDPEKPESNKTVDNEKVKECVFIVENGVAKMVTIKSGIQDNNFIQIESGLKPGQTVITGPFTAVSKTLKDNDKIEVVDKKQLFESKGKSIK